MADAEPSNAELARRLDTIMVVLQSAVGRPEYTADQRHTEHRFTEIERDLEDVRRTHVDDIKEVFRRFDEQSKSGGSNLRQVLYSGLLPAVFLVVSLLVTVLLAFKGK